MAGGTTPGGVLGLRVFVIKGSWGMVVACCWLVGCCLLLVVVEFLFLEHPWDTLFRQLFENKMEGNANWMCWDAKPVPSNGGWWWPLLLAGSIPSYVLLDCPLSVFNKNIWPMKLASASEWENSSQQHCDIFSRVIQPTHFPLTSCAGFPNLHWIKEGFKGPGPVLVYNPNLDLSIFGDFFYWFHQGHHFCTSIFSENFSNHLTLTNLG